MTPLWETRKPESTGVTCRATKPAQQVEDKPFLTFRFPHGGDKASGGQRPAHLAGFRCEHLTEDARAYIPLGPGYSWTSFGGLPESSARARPRRGSGDRSLPSSCTDMAWEAERATFHLQRRATLDVQQENCQCKAPWLTSRLEYLKHANGHCKEQCGLRREPRGPGQPLPAKGTAGTGGREAAHPGVGGSAWSLIEAHCVWGGGLFFKFFFFF